MKTLLIIGNWKMHGRKQENEVRLNALKHAIKTQGVAVCLPYPYLYQAEDILHNTPIAWGAQDVAEFADGAYTGEVSAGMLVDFACTYVICGHSERRRLLGEKEDVVGRKAKTAQMAGLVPIVCIGETLQERDEGLTEKILTLQVEAVLKELPDQNKVIWAYEPVWAIGTGKAATPTMANDVHLFLKEKFALNTILYGGSVNPDNVKSFCEMEAIDGALVGGASLDPQTFLTLIQNSGLN